jgi:hypothetical protein
MTFQPGAIPVVNRIVDEIFCWILGSDPYAAADCHVGVNKASLGPALGLSSSSVLVLSSLAPGADQIVADAALKRGCSVKGALPFPRDHYLRASTFIGREDAESQLKEFAVLEDRIRKHNLFHVLRPEDVSLTVEELDAVLERDLHDRVQRNHRYRAAGDYIAVNCDLLIAVCSRAHESDPLKPQDGLPIDAQPGAEFIIQTRLRGLTPGTLPEQQALTWADNGPVLRVYANRPDDKPATPPIPVGQVEVWPPRDSRPHTTSHEDWNEHEMESLRDYARLIEELNIKLRGADPVDAQAESTSMLVDRPRDDYVPTGTVSRQWKTLKAMFRRRRAVVATAPRTKLEAIAALRRRVASLNAEYDGQIKRLIGKLFLWTFIIVTLLQFYENWTEEPANSPDIDVTRVVFFGAALGIFLAGWAMYARATSRRLNNWQNDLRSIAEGLRVQFYWAAAGVGESVASHYLQRTRDELSWIRGAISAAILPVDEDRASFRALSESEKRSRLKQINNGWIKEQLEYFRKRSYEFAEKQHSLHFAGNVLLIAGFTLVLASFAAQTLKLSGVELSARSLGTSAMWIWVAAVGVAWAAFQILTEVAWRLPPQSSEASEGSHWNAARIYRNVYGFIRGPYVLWPMGIGLAWAMLSTAYGLTGVAGVPDAHKIIAIFKALCFTAGGLLHSWAVVKFFGENARRYFAMAGLFRGAYNRCNDLLKRIEADSRPLDDYNEHLRDVRDLLVALGKEALSENADWLEMHRVHPVEPIWPGA